MESYEIFATAFGIVYTLLLVLLSD